MKQPKSSSDLRPFKARCARCGARITRASSQLHGLGPRCSERIGDNRALFMPWRGTVAVLPFDPTTGDITCTRDSAGVMQFNISQAITRYTIYGFDWGRPGEASQEFAINVLNWFVPPSRSGKKAILEAHDYEHPIKCYFGRCSAFAERWHLDFSARYIENFPPCGATISGIAIQTYIAEKISIGLSQQKELF